MVAGHVWGQNQRKSRERATLTNDKTQNPKIGCPLKRGLRPTALAGFAPCRWLPPPRAPRIRDSFPSQTKCAQRQPEAIAGHRGKRLVWCATGCGLTGSIYFAQCSLMAPCRKALHLAVGILYTSRVREWGRFWCGFDSRFGRRRDWFECSG